MSESIEAKVDDLIRLWALDLGATWGEISDDCMNAILEQTADRADPTIVKGALNRVEGARRLRGLTRRLDRHEGAELLRSLLNGKSSRLCLCPATSEYDPPCQEHGVKPIGMRGDGTYAENEYA